jgi:hypothetical protein
MSTNRTKIDWAYRQAQKIAITVASINPANITERPTALRFIAGILRQAERRGIKLGMIYEGARAMSPAKPSIPARKPA